MLSIHIICNIVKWVCPCWSLCIGIGGPVEGVWPYLYTLGTCAHHILVFVVSLSGVFVRASN